MATIEDISEIRCVVHTHICIRMRDIDPPEGPLHQAPYNTPQDVASNPRSLVQVAEEAHPLLQRRPPANRMRERRNNHTHEEVAVVGGAAPHG